VGILLKMAQKNKLVWLFSGTSDGNQIAKDLISENFRIKVFVASQYGMSVASKVLPENVIEIGRLTEKEIFKRGQIENPHQVIDATHPFALEISRNLMSFCKENGTPYIRYERPEEEFVGENIYYVESIQAAADKARTLGENILLTLGSKNIDPFLGEGLKERVFIRMLPDPQLIQQLLSKGVAPDRIIAIQGPFSIAFNHAMIDDRGIDCLVTKSSGKEGGVPEKIAAAEKNGCSVIIVKRPEIDYPLLFNNRDDLKKHVTQNHH
jgi:precorrin-3B C17-methyltransferase